MKQDQVVSIDTLVAIVKSCWSSLCSMSWLQHHDVNFMMSISLSQCQSNGMLSMSLTSDRGIMAWSCCVMHDVNIKMSLCQYQDVMMLYCHNIKMPRCYVMSVLCCQGHNVNVKRS